MRSLVLAHNGRIMRDSPALGPDVGALGGKKGGAGRAAQRGTAWATAYSAVRSGYSKEQSTETDRSLRADRRHFREVGALWGT